MARRRRIVPDTSVIVPALFSEIIEYRGSRFDLTRRATPIVEAIRAGRVEAFAPYTLISEFMKVARRRASSRETSQRVDSEFARRQYVDFLALPVTYVDLKGLGELPWELAEKHGLSPGDAWFLACARQMGAELWISQRHRDGFADAAARAWDRVFVLTESRFAQR